MKIELKERTKVMNILESGNLGDKPKASIGLLARYYIEQGKEKNEIINTFNLYLRIRFVRKCGEFKLYGEVNYEKNRG